MNFAHVLFLRNSLQVVAVDSAIPRHAVFFREKNFGRNVADRTCNGGNGYFAKIFQRGIPR